ncbi:MAG: hypothetical protein ACLGQW_07655 [Acidobacteriota bacterium]
MLRYFIILLVLMGVLPSSARADAMALEIYYTSNTYGYFDPCPG